MKLNNTTSREAHELRTRREFLNTSASGLGLSALGAMLAEDGLLSAARASDASARPPASAAGLRIVAVRYGPRYRTPLAAAGVRAPRRPAALSVAAA